MILRPESDLPLFAAAAAREQQARTPITQASPACPVLAEPAPSATAEIVFLPFARRALLPDVDKLARRFARYDGNRAAFFLRKEIEKVFYRLCDKGIPEQAANADAIALERAVWARMAVLVRHGDGAA